MTLGAAPRRCCSYCRRPGHRIGKCPLLKDDARLEVPGAELAIVDDRTARISELRERCDALAMEIKQSAVAWAIGRCEVAEIDALNILQASLAGSDGNCRE